MAFQSPTKKKPGATKPGAAAPYDASTPAHESSTPDASAAAGAGPKPGAAPKAEKAKTDPSKWRVDTKHKAYEEILAVWERCRDTRAGSDAVKKAGPKYLPPLGSHVSNGMGTEGAVKYNAYKMRALFFNAVGRTIDGLAGLVFQKPPEVKTGDK